MGQMSVGHVPHQLFKLYMDNPSIPLKFHSILQVLPIELPFCKQRIQKNNNNQKKDWEDWKLSNKSSLPSTKTRPFWRAPALFSRTDDKGDLAAIDPISICKAEYYLDEVS